MIDAQKTPNFILLAEALDGLRKIDSRDCSEDAYERLEAAIADLESINAAFGSERDSKNPSAWGILAYFGHKKGWHLQFPVYSDEASAQRAVICNYESVDHEVVPLFLHT